MAATRVSRFILRSMYLRIEHQRHSLPRPKPDRALRQRPDRQSDSVVIQNDILSMPR